MKKSWFESLRAAVLMTVVLQSCPAIGQEPKAAGTSPLSGTPDPLGSSPHSADKTDSETLRTLKAQIDELKADYEKRINGLETQLEEIQKQLLQAAPENVVEPTSPARRQSGPIHSRRTESSHLGGRQFCWPRRQQQSL